jgi:hypothetical protein
MLSGVLSEYERQHQDRVDREVSQTGGSKKLITV